MKAVSGALDARSEEQRGRPVFREAAVGSREGAN